MEPWHVGKHTRTWCAEWVRAGVAWLTKIVADEQVEYRLKEQAGCTVVEAGEAETVVLDDVENSAVDYRLRPEGGAALVCAGCGRR